MKYKCLLGGRCDVLDSYPGGFKVSNRDTTKTWDKNQSYAPMALATVLLIQGLASGSFLRSSSRSSTFLQLNIFIRKLNKREKTTAKYEPGDQNN